MPEIRVPADQVFPILKNNILVDGFHIVIDLEKSHGSVIVDALTGKEYIDCYTYFATLPVGHNHPKMVDGDFRASLMRAALANPANSDIYSQEFAAFVKTFRRIAVPREFTHLFFIAGGALAVENAMKAAFDWKAQKNRAKGIEGGADKILHFREAFHGRSGYTLSVTNTEPLKIRDFPRFDWPRVSNPKITFPMDEAAVATAEAQSVREIEEAFARDPSGIAAILIEPIQCEGGDNHFRPEFMGRLRALADEHEALLIFDEVQTGMGVTGTMWAFEQLGATPDLVSFGKKTQVCGIMSTGRIDDVESNVFRVSSRINSTWGGNLVDMVRCARYLEIIQEDKLVRSAATVGAAFKAGLVELQQEFEQVTNARGRGLLLAFDVPDGESRELLRQRCWANGLATLACGPRSVRFRPSLTFTEEDVRRSLEILRKQLKTTAKLRTKPKPMPDTL
ncbi:MAG: L-lysine 6-transaminase [Gemmatimonadota bacterium]|nr:MAG: L-lysine 6-transaminase [Gemmatimonadota bacterium]